MCPEKAGKVLLRAMLLEVAEELEKSITTDFAKVAVYATVAVLERLGITLSKPMCEGILNEVRAMLKQEDNSDNKIQPPE